VSVSPYPASWEVVRQTGDGRSVEIRPIVPNDAPALSAFHATLSDSTIYLRYFAPHPNLSPGDLDHLTRVDYHDRVALVAIDQGRIVGVGRFDRVDDVTAEAAFVVCDDHQGHGLGGILLDQLIRAARDVGVQTLVAEVLPRNGRMLKTFEHAGLPMSTRTQDGVVELSMSLGPEGDDRMSP